MNCFSTLAAVPALFCESPGRALRTVQAFSSAF